MKIVRFSTFVVAATLLSLSMAPGATAGAGPGTSRTRAATNTQRRIDPPSSHDVRSRAFDPFRVSPSIRTLPYPSQPHYRAPILRVPTTFVCPVCGALGCCPSCPKHKVTSAASRAADR